MTPQTRRNVLRYGIPIDLIIVATGVGMLVPPTTAVLLVLFAAAVLLSTWKGGWQGGLTALILSVAMLAAMFGFHAGSLAAFSGAMALSGGALAATLRPRTPADDAARAARVREKEEQRAARERRKAEERAERERREAEERAEREREEAERAARAREEAEARAQREAEERVAREAREAREAEERAEREREEAERAARARQEAEARAKREAEERVAREAREAEERAAREREEAERAARARQEAEARAKREAEERVARQAREAQERAEREREEAKRGARARQEAEARAKREAEERVAREAEERAEREREEAERAARAREEAEARAKRKAEERVAREAEERAKREAEERAKREREETERAARARQEAERAAHARQEAEARAKREAEERVAREAREAEERAKREADEREQAARAARERVAAPPKPAAPAPPPPAGPNLLDTVSGWFKREPRPRVVNLAPRSRATSVTSSSTATRRPVRPSPSKDRGPRLVFLERRRGTADTIVPRLRQRGFEVSVVERWVDAVDELLRLKPDAFFVDVEHPDFEKAHRVTTDKSRNLPIILTARSAASVPRNARYAAFTVRPYDFEEIVRIGEKAFTRADELLAMQTMQRTPSREAAPAPVAPPPRPRVQVAPQPREAVSNDEYEVACFSCRVSFNAIESDWCSCLAKERTLVCTNCLSCFCKAPPSYKEKFWVEAPPRLFERKTSDAKRQQGSLPPNPAPGAVQQPLVLTVEDDEEIQAIVHRVCMNLGYGFIHATNGQDGLDLAHEYRPNLILSDAFMPKLDGREMCRMLKEDGAFSDTPMVVMTGLYTDTKYRSEALKRFKVDDYIAKPVSITDLINILQKHLEGVSGMPVQDDLHELHRRELELDENDVPLADVLFAGETQAEARVEVAAVAPAPKVDTYQVSCYNCDELFDATHAEWCRCVGRDNTLVCTDCGGCFCKAPAAYKERFWIDAPPSLFERKMIGSKRSLGGRSNPSAMDVKRPLILLVEDDENVQLIVRTVVTNMGFGFVVGANGQEGLTLAREYTPDLILSDAFMPKLDGREMCRLLKEDPTTSASKAIIMTGLYTDRKYRNEALDYFKVDDYVAKPLAVDDLIKLFKKHLPTEVVTAH